MSSFIRWFIRTVLMESRRYRPSHPTVLTYITFSITASKRSRSSSTLVWRRSKHTPSKGALYSRWTALRVHVWNFCCADLVATNASPVPSLSYGESLLYGHGRPSYLLFCLPVIYSLHLCCSCPGVCILSNGYFVVRITKATGALFRTYYPQLFIELRDTGQ